MATIYLSSTYEDLKNYRRTVFDALRKDGHHVIAMEDYVAADQRPVDQCLNDVSRADIYVGLFGFRYGYVPPSEHNNPDGLSITELEFRHAESLGKPCLTFMVSDEARWQRKFIDLLTDTPIHELRDRLRTDKLASFFSEPHELASQVQSAVKQQLDRMFQPSTTSPQMLVPTTSWDIEEQGSPYPGLFHFTRKYARVFFGRDSEVRAILDRMRESEGRFMIISGDSGVGKSSIIDAGILPVLEDEGLEGGEKCQTVRMVPGQRQPFDALLTALGSLVTRAGLHPDRLLEEVTRVPETLGNHIRTIMQQVGSAQALILFIDQMEELFTAQDSDQAKPFLSALYRAAQEHALKVIGTIRSDHLHHCHRHPDLVKVLRGRGHYPLGTVEPYMIQDMIVKPAQAAGLTIGESFARRLIHDAEVESGNLPLLAFVMAQLYERRSGHVLSETVYDELGGITGAIAAHVKAVEEKIQSTLHCQPEHVFPAIFQNLVKMHKEKGIPTRNRPLRTAFSGTTRHVVDLLVSERLLWSEGEGEHATVSISHEKLFEAWPALKDYVETHQKTLMDRTLLESRAQKWEKMGKPWMSGLATGREYHDFRQAGLSSTDLTKEFLQASRWARRTWSIMGLIVLLLLGGVTWLWQKGYNMEQAILKVQSLVVSIHLVPKPEDMVAIPGGTFQQGDVERLGEGWRNPVRTVRIAPFAMGKHEVTCNEYDRFAIATDQKLPEDQGWGRGQRPVINVSWNDAKAYAVWLSEETGNHYRLPTESEWEYAARSGEKQEAWAGTSEKSQLENFAVYAANSGNLTAIVGSKQANSFGIKDLTGNVWEWVEDCWHWGYDRGPVNGAAWVEGEGVDCEKRTLRGGSWNSNVDSLRTSGRLGYTAVSRGSVIGFRLVQTGLP